MCIISIRIDITSLSIELDSDVIDGEYTYTEYSTSINISLAIDAYPHPLVTLARNAGTMFNLSRVVVSNTTIQFVGPLYANDSGNYTVIATNAAGTITKSLWINVQCKCIIIVS